MRGDKTIAVVIPALNEELAIGKVLRAIPDWVDDIVVADNGSTDSTAEVATCCGARVIDAPQRGYGSACLVGIASLENPDIVVFLDADFSDDPTAMDKLVDPIIEDRAQMVIGSRVLGNREKGALTPQARFGNMLACFLIHKFWDVRFTDLGPFRAIRSDTLRQLKMNDPDFGWTVEMQIKAARDGVRSLEVPADYRCRIGQSKISGTIKGVFAAGYKILFTIFRAALQQKFSPPKTQPKPPDDHVIIFTRYPQPGTTKTRLIPELGELGAAELQREMTEHAVRRARAFRNQHPVTIEVRYEGGNPQNMRAWLDPSGTETKIHGAALRHQDNGDLGQRMQAAFCKAFEEGKQKVLIIGCDVPGINAEIYAEAFDALKSHDLILGPASDGGYYLIGLNKMFAELFEGITWGEKKVRETTLAIAEKLGLRVHQLPMLDDLDRPEDLHVWEEEKQRCTQEQFLPAITIIIPTLNEESSITKTIETARNKAAGPVEILVVDGGSTDDTLSNALAAEAKTLEFKAGRALQMNHGASQATGGILLFLHADTLLPDYWDNHVRRCLTHHQVQASAFSFATDSEQTASMRFIVRLTNWRARKRQLPYGDQAIFLHAKRFHDIGGFVEMPIMEDYDLVKRLGKLGRIHILRLPAITSGRRWKKLGIWKTTLINQLVVFGYNLGVSPQRLASFYNKKNRRS